MPSNVDDINLQWLESLSNESLKIDREYFHVYPDSLGRRRNGLPAGG
jgi:hypothetical protein